MSNTHTGKSVFRQSWDEAQKAYATEDALRRATEKLAELEMERAKIAAADAIATARAAVVEAAKKLGPDLRRLLYEHEQSNARAMRYGADVIDPSKLEEAMIEPKDVAALRDALAAPPELRHNAENSSTPEPREPCPTRRITILCGRYVL